jgi:hypothetical protein
MTVSNLTFPAGRLDLYLAVNDRRLAAYDARLLRPGSVLVMVRLTRRVMGAAKTR